MCVGLSDSSDRNALFDVWWSPVRATHGFVREEDLQEMIPQVRQYVAAEPTDFWVLCDDAGAVVGAGCHATSDRFRSGFPHTPRTEAG